MPSPRSDSPGRLPSWLAAPVVYFASVSALTVLPVTRAKGNPVHMAETFHNSRFGVRLSIPEGWTAQPGPAGSPLIVLLSVSPRKLPDLSMWGPGKETAKIALEPDSAAEQFCRHQFLRSIGLIVDPQAHESSPAESVRTLLDKIKHYDPSYVTTLQELTADPKLRALGAWRFAVRKYGGRNPLSGKELFLKQIVVQWIRAQHVLSLIYTDWQLLESREDIDFEAVLTYLQ